MNDLLARELGDLQLFADPFEEFTSAPRAHGWTARFVRKGEEIALRRESDGAIRTLAGPGQPKYRNLKGLLVSETFANLERLASAQMYRTAHLADPDSGKLKAFLPVAGEIRWSDGRNEDLTFERVCEILAGTEDRLRVFVIDGSAGVGKSHLIEQIVRRRAAPASYKSGMPLLLHVESRGKVLTSLNDRIAGTLSSLRASFFEEELKPLIRRSAVQLAVDGFDELSDSRGYVRAWGALRDVWMADLLGIQKVSLDGCHMTRLDVRGANLVGVRFSNTKVFELVADPFVTFGESVPNVRSIILYEHFKETRLFEGVTEWIAQRSQAFGPGDSAPDDRWLLLEKFARISMRQYSIRSVPDQMDPASTRIIASSLWPGLRDLLNKHDRLEVYSTSSASGPRSEWFHLVAGEEFLNPERASQPSTRRILEELSVRSPMEK